MPIEFIDEAPPAAPQPLTQGSIVFLDDLTPEEQFDDAKSQGPAAELDFLDQRDKRMEELSFDEWKRREQLLNKSSFWDRHVVRNMGGVSDALGGMWDTLTGAVSELADVGEDFRKGRTSYLDTVQKFVQTGGEAGLLGAVDFTEAALGSLLGIGGMVEDAVAADTPEKEDKLGYQMYKERLKARQYRAKISQDSAAGTLAGGLVQMATGDLEQAVAVQKEAASGRMQNVAEVGAMFTPMNPLNVVPMGVGADAAQMGAAAARGAAWTADGVAKAATVLDKATDIGSLVEKGITKFSPGISTASAEKVRRMATAATWGGLAAAGVGGYATDSTGLQAIVGAYAGLRGGLWGAQKGGQFAAAVARAASQGPRLQSTLKRVSRDPGVPEWAARTAAALEKAGGTQVGRSARAAAAGAVTGGAISGAFSVASGASEPEIAGAIASGAVPGAGLGMAGDWFNRAIGGDRDMRINTERMLLAEAQRERGGDAAAQLFYDLPEADQLSIGTIQAIMGPAASIEVVNAEDFKAKTGGKAGAGVWIDPKAHNGIGSVIINADAARKKGVTALHEFSHALTMMQAPDEITSAIRDTIPPEELKAFENDYLDRIVASMRRSGEMRDPESRAEYDDMGFPVRDTTRARDVEGDRGKARKKLVNEVGEDWLEHEFWAEKGAEMLAGSDIAKMADTGEWEPRAARNLRMQQSVLRSAGVQFNADGSPIAGEFMGKALSDTGEKALGQLLAKYVRDLADYSPRLGAEAKKISDMDAGKGPATNFGPGLKGVADHPAFAKTWDKTAGGGKENAFATVDPDGNVTLKTPKQIEFDEMKQVAELGKLFPRRGPKADRENPLVMRRDRDGGGEEVSGTVLPEPFFGSEAFSDATKQKARAIQDIMNSPNGETMTHWYHQIGSGSSSSWAAAVRKRLGNVRSSRREIRPLSFFVSEAGNLGVRVLDMLAMKAKSRDWGAQDKLGLWNGNLDSFHGDIKKMMANWSQGVPGDTGLGGTKHAAILDFLGKDGSKDALIKTFRIDRMEDVNATGHTGFTFDYGKWKRRQRGRERQRMREQPAAARPKRAIGMPKDPTPEPKPLTGDESWPESWRGILGSAPETGQRVSARAEGASPGNERPAGRGPVDPTVAARELATLEGRATDSVGGNITDRQVEKARQLDRIRELTGDAGQKLYDKVSKKPLREDEGFEHNVYVYRRPNGDLRVMKATKGNGFGTFGDGTPHSYMRRMALMNQLWPELDIQLVGVATRDPASSYAKPTLVTDMAFVEGQSLAPSTLRRKMLDRGWYDVGADYYEHEGMNVKINDVHSGNIRWNPETDRIVPIDIDVAPLDPDKPVRVSDQSMRFSPDDIADDVDLASLKPVQSKMDAERLYADGKPFYAFHDMDDDPSPVTSLDMLKTYSAEQLYYDDAPAMRQSPDDIDEGIARHSLMAERGARATNKFGVLSAAESEALTTGLSTVGAKLADKARKTLAEGKVSAKEQQKLKDQIRKLTTKAGAAELAKQARDIKAAHPTQAGWEKLELVGIDNLTGDLKWKQIPYSFERSPAGKLLTPGTPDYTRRVETLGNRMKDAVGVVYDRAQAGDAAAKKIISQASWYKAMRSRLRREFGGLGDLFADLLGATSPNTPVRTNWDFAVEALQGATNGDFDLLIPAWEEWVRKVDAKETQLRAYIEPLLGTTTKKALKADPEYQRLLGEVKEARDLPDELLPRRGGKKFGFNGQNAVRAMVDLWRVVKDPDDMMAIGGTAPKAQNFSGNLIGFKDRATIDVWAGRLLQRMAGFNRVPSVAEGGISGNVLSDGRTTLQFGFGQDVFRRAAELIRNDPTLSTDEKLARIGEDDLQAVVWFLEKEEWTRNNWTSAAGEGGSFEFEADVAGIMDRARLKELRRIADSSKSSQAAKAAALSEIDQMSREVDRYAGGLSIQQSAGNQGVDYVPDNPAQAKALQRLHNAVYATAPKDTVIGSKTASTLGRYGSDERSFDVEVVARDGYDPAPLWDEMRSIARDAKQDAAFLARILRDDEDVDPLYHRPGAEIYFQSAKAGEAMQRALERLDEMGAGFHTVIVDGRRNPQSRSGEMPAAVGVRIIRLPEFDARYGDSSWSALTDEQLRAKMVQARTELEDLARALIIDNPDVSAAVVSDYEVRTEFNHEYRDQQESAGPSPTGGRGRGTPWQGRSVRDAVEAAGRRAGDAGTPAGDGGVPGEPGGDGGGDAS